MRRAGKTATLKSSHGNFRRQSDGSAWRTVRPAHDPWDADKVTDILGLLAAGAPEQEILEDFPWLEAADIRAALEYAAHELREKAVR